MPHTTDNDKKAQDNNALRHEKNMMREKIARQAKINILRKQIINKWSEVATPHSAFFYC